MNQGYFLSLSHTSMCLMDFYEFNLGNILLNTFKFTLTLKKKTSDLRIQSKEMCERIQKINLYNLTVFFFFFKFLLCIEFQWIQFLSHYVAHGTFLNRQKSRIIIIYCNTLRRKSFSLQFSLFSKAKYQSMSIFSSCKLSKLFSFWPLQFE